MIFHCINIYIFFLFLCICVGQYWGENVYLLNFFLLFFLISYLSRSILGCHAGLHAAVGAELLRWSAFGHHCVQTAPEPTGADRRNRPAAVRSETHTKYISHTSASGTISTTKKHVGQY